MALRDQRLALRRRGPAGRLPAVGWHAVAEGSAKHEHQVDRRQRQEGLPHAVGAARREVLHQQRRQRRADHGAAAETHDGEAGGHAAAVGEPLDQGRDRGDVAQPQADAAEHAGAQPDDPQLVGVDADRAHHQAAAPAQRRDHAGLARPGALQPAAPQRGGDAEEDDEQGEGEGLVRHRPVAAAGEQVGDPARVLVAGRIGAGQQLGHRQPEHREAVGHADAQVNGERRRRHQPAVETGSRNGPFLGQYPQLPRPGGSGNCASDTRHAVLSSVYLYMPN